MDDCLRDWRARRDELNEAPLAAVESGDERMSSISVAHKVFLEDVLGMSTGYVLDFTNASFGSLFRDIEIDIYDPAKYPGFGDSKAERMRGLWKWGSDAEVSSAVYAIVDYIEAKRAGGRWSMDVTDEQVARMRTIASHLQDRSAARARPSAVTTEATVTNNKIQIEIHEDIYNHIERYLTAGDYFHAVEESYKVVREKLRELAGDEAATDVFNMNAQSTKHYGALFGKAAPGTQAEGDFFRGVGYLHLGVQFLRNEKAHSLATFVEPNLAIHYISLASLAYDLITRSVDEETIKELDELVREKRRSYSAGAFYKDFENGKWLQSMKLPVGLASASVRKVLKDKWLKETDLTRNWDHSNVMFMRLELVVDQLTQVDIDFLLDLPTKDSYGNDQEAGMWPFLEFVEQQRPGTLSQRAKDWLAAQRQA